MFRVICCLTNLLLFGLLVQTGAAQPADTTEKDVRLDTTITVSLHPSLPKYHIHVVESDTAPDTNDPRDQVMLYDIVVRSRTGGPPLQSIKELALGTFDDVVMDTEQDPVYGISLRDVNFDGYTDLEVYGGGSQHQWTVYLFSPKKRQFLKSKELTGLGNQLILHPDKKEFEVMRQGSSPVSLVTETYKVQGDKYILVRRVSEDPNPAFTVVTTEELINGVLTQTSKDTVQQSGTDN